MCLISHCFQTCSVNTRESIKDLVLLSITSVNILQIITQKLVQCHTNFLTIKKHLIYGCSFKTNVDSTASFSQAHALKLIWTINFLYQNLCLLPIKKQLDIWITYKILNMRKSRFSYTFSESCCSRNVQIQLWWLARLSGQTDRVRERYYTRPTIK